MPGFGERLMLPRTASGEHVNEHAAHRMVRLRGRLLCPNFRVGRYCDDAGRCHHSLLAELLREASADVTFQQLQPPR